MSIDARANKEMLRVSLVQTSVAWESPTANRAHFDALLKDVTESDIVVLPEMFSTGFSMASSSLAETMEGATVNWMQDAAGRGGFALCGSIIISEDEQYFNRFVWTTGQSAAVTYDKRHLFRMAGETRYYSPGQERVVIASSGIRVCPQICYDLRFPAWSRNLEAFDLLVYVANWPASRSAQWRTLLQARAIENACYAVGVNRIGVDGNDVEYSGDSCVIDYQGKILLDMTDSDALASWDLDLPTMRQYREDFPVHLDADRFHFEM